MKLEWEQMPQGYTGLEAEGDHGTWRIVTDGNGWWHLTVQPPFTRGMLGRGKFRNVSDAKAHAQDRDNDVPIQPQQIGPSA